MAIPGFWPLNEERAEFGIVFDFFPLSGNSAAREAASCKNLE